MDDEDRTRQDLTDLNLYRVNRTDAMIHSELRALYRYWNELRAGRKTPLRSDIDPREMDCDARNLFILENLGRGNIRFRLAGTAIVDAFGMELRGMNARAIMSTGSRESFTALITETLEDPAVGYARLRNATDDTELWEVSLLPLRSDFGMIDRVIGCLHPLTVHRGATHWPPCAFASKRCRSSRLPPQCATSMRRNRWQVLPSHAVGLIPCQPSPPAPKARKPAFARSKAGALDRMKTVVHRHAATCAWSRANVCRRGAACAPR